MLQQARDDDEDFELDQEAGYRDADLEMAQVDEDDDEEDGGTTFAAGSSSKGSSTRQGSNRKGGQKKRLGKEPLRAQSPEGIAASTKSEAMVDPVAIPDDHVPEQGRGLRDEDEDRGGEDDDEEEDADDDDDEDEDDEEDEEDDDEDDDDEEIEEYETSLGLHGEERDGDYPSGEDEEDDLLSRAPRTFNESGDPLSSDDHERQAALDEAEALFGALAGAAARSGGGPGGGGGGDGGFGSAFQALRGMMTGMTNRLKGLLAALKTKEGTATAKLHALQELAELLSISTEDTLAGYFQIEAFSKELVAIVRGDSNGLGSGGGDDDDAGMGGEGAMTAEEAIAFGLDPAEVCGGGGGGGGMADTEENDVQMMLLACRCLANLMEALPGSAHSVVYAGAVPVLCTKLQDIQYIELAEQTLSTLEKISEEVPSSIVREGGLSALLTYLDFFSFHVQRTAVTAAANCCRSLTLDSFDMVKDAIPIFKNILGYPDQRVVEQACLAVVRIVDSYRHHPDKLEQLFTADLLTAIKALLNPDSTTVGPSTYTQCLKALTTATKASPAVATNLVELEIANTLYHLLTGVAPPEWTSDEGKQVLDRQTTAEDDMLVMQNLVQRPKEQVQETLNLVVELLPALPKDGIFDARAFIPGKSSKSASTKAIKKEEGSPVVVKREDTEATPDLAATEGRGSGGGAASGSKKPSPDVSADIKMEAPSDDNNSLAVTPTLSRASSSHRSSRSNKARNSTKDVLAQKRLELVSTEASPKRQLVVKRYFALLLPILIDVYSASVSPQVRSKAVLGLVKIVQFCDEQALADILHVSLQPVVIPLTSTH